MTAETILITVHSHFDELDEISYLKKYDNLFHQEMEEFVNCELLEKDIETEFNTSLLKLEMGEYYDTRRISLEIKRDRQLDAITL